MPETLPAHSRVNPSACINLGGVIGVRSRFLIPLKKSVSSGSVCHRGQVSLSNNLLSARWSIV